MRNDLLEMISAITAEEKEILAYNSGINKLNYTTSKNFVVQGADILGNKLIDIRPHTRFCKFPLHGHDYMEIMYVLEGSIIHNIDGNVITLKKGDLLLLNKHIFHSIEKAEINDIGVNFILSDNFLNSMLKDLQQDNILTKFVANNFDENSSQQYIHFRVGDIYSIKNILDNLVFTLTGIDKKDTVLLPQAVSLLFGYLSLHRECIIANNLDIKKEAPYKKEITDYINENYQKATLDELSKKLALSMEYLCRKIKKLFGKSFKELLLEQRLLVAEKLLVSTDMKINEIIYSIGYENSSHFHKKFFQKHSITPYQWRKNKTTYK